MCIRDSVGGDAVLKSVRIGEILDVWPFYNLYAVNLICGSGSIYHIVVYKEAFGKLDFRHFSEGSGIGKHAGQSRYCGRLGGTRLRSL